VTAIFLAKASGNLQAAAKTFRVWNKRLMSLSVAPWHHQAAKTQNFNVSGFTNVQSTFTVIRVKGRHAGGYENVNRIFSTKTNMKFPKASCTTLAFNQVVFEKITTRASSSLH